MKPINVAFIGLGRIADLHYLGYKNNKQAKLFAICDISQKLVEQRAKQWHVTAFYTDYNDLRLRKMSMSISILIDLPL